MHHVLLKPSEKNYAQVDREGLAVYWAVKHYRQYLYCQKFELHTDCSALVKIFGPKNDLDGCATGRLNRWTAQLMEYDFTISHIKGASNTTSDSLSRLPVCTTGDQCVPYPVGSNITRSSLLNQLSVKGAECVVGRDCSAVLSSVQYLAMLPTCNVINVDIRKVVGSAPTAAWDILPLTVSDVAKATREDRGIWQVTQCCKVRSY